MSFEIIEEAGYLSVKVRLSGGAEEAQAVVQGVLVAQSASGITGVLLDLGGSPEAAKVKAHQISEALNRLAGRSPA
jgi:hypothetical protein